MSWVGFKKAINRAGNQAIIKDIDRVSDKEFDNDERRYQTLKEHGETLSRESKEYLDAMRIVSSSQIKIAEVMDSMFEGSNDEAKITTDIGKHYLRAVTDFDSEVVKKLDDPYLQTVLDPIIKYSFYFKEIDEAIKKREHKMKDYEALKAKVRRLTDKPSKDATKLPKTEKELSLAKDIFDNLNDQLKAELPQLIALRVPYFDPSFEAFIKIQYRFSTEAYSRLSQMQQFLTQTDRDNYVNGNLDKQIDSILQQMLQLDISTLGFN